MTPQGAVFALLIVAVAGGAAYQLLTGGPDLRVELRSVGGYTDNVPVWMPFKLSLHLTNAGDESITIRRIDVEPDLDNFNEAFASASPYDLSPPILLEPGAARDHEAGVTLLNANQLPERAYTLVFIVRFRTDVGDIVQRFPMQLDYAREPARRALRR
jgi:hypothetical protein